ncbi:ABC transporter substrate-binding protein [Thermodesulfobacteriota bacterium]
MKTRLYLILTVLSVSVFMFSGYVLSANQRPNTLAELVLYKGNDRQKILEEGAQKEGNLTFYTSGILKQAVRPVVNTFQKKYPFIKVRIWRAGSTTLLPKVLEEHKAGSHQFDVIESTQMTQMALRNSGIIQSFYSPNLINIEEGAITKAPNGGVFQAGFRESGIGVGYNTKLITREQLPKTYHELLDPRWKGKLAITGTLGGRTWVGTMLVAYGEQFVKQIAKQDFDVHFVSGRALLDMVIAGEYPFSPTLYDSHALNSKKNGAPCDWVPLEPVHINLGQIALSKYSSHPHAALLFIDHELSKKSAEIHKDSGYATTRIDVPGRKTYKKFYSMKSKEEAQKWFDLFERLFLLR